MIVVLVGLQLLAQSTTTQPSNDPIRLAPTRPSLQTSRILTSTTQPRGASVQPTLATICPPNGSRDLETNLKNILAAAASATSKKDRTEIHSKAARTLAEKINLKSEKTSDELNENSLSLLEDVYAIGESTDNIFNTDEIATKEMNETKRLLARSVYSNLEKLLLRAEKKASAIIFRINKDADGNIIDRKFYNLDLSDENFQKKMGIFKALRDDFENPSDESLRKLEDLLKI